MNARRINKTVTSISVLSFNNGERLSYTAPAYLLKDAEGFTLNYNEPGMQGIETALSFKNGRLLLSRSDGTRLTFEKDAATSGVYCMFCGVLDAEIKTSALSFKEEGDKNVLSLCYELRMGGQDFSSKMKITFSGC
jgi:uncharacterized beta-barrel protein YwiB (DUF1934 family)